MLGDEPAGELVQEILPAILDLGVQRPRPILFAGALREAKRALRLPVELLCIDFIAIARGGEVLQP